VSIAGRPPDFHKQHIVGLALACCARSSTATPSSELNNFFPPFAERFFEHSAGLSVEDKGHGIGRRIAVAPQARPIEIERAALLNKTTRE
jgi:hypothetical protein